MQSFTNTIISETSPAAKDIIEIKMWSLYLLTSTASLYNAIIETSLDHGPVEKNPHKPGRITFRFDNREWEGRIKKLLYVHRIPVIVSNSFSTSPTFTKHQRLIA